MVREVRGAGRRAGAAAVVFAAAVLVGGCSAGGGSVVASDSAKRDAAAPAAAPPVAASPGGAGAGAAAGEAAGRPGGGAGQPSAVQVADNRLIAYTAQLSLRSKDVPAVLAKARELASSAGGYVGGETVSGGGDENAGQTGQITVKVPSATFQQTLDQFAALGEVLSRRSQADDLTQQVADVSSRLQTQQASVDRVRALMTQAKTLAEVTSLEGELSRREADLESLQKQLKELSARTSLSTITLDVRRDPKPVHDQPDVKKEKDEGFWSSVGSALGGGWHALVTVVRVLAMALAAVAPFLLVAGPAVAAAWLVRRRRARTPRAAVPPVPPMPEHLPSPREEADGERREA
ncbi:DUF4349 domain-containing protein [Kitasatospora sp. CM 4170]|uniref:DUF4349 domain-containing protein n=1 Tax=Kitasatospora aburaviensis TaxID=67265 RepID=A0ABW1EWE2_9ACTN|nr:DUF4349 domain-containing protein [Kitasatospora sp. CM 4170]WNM48075.1 DUF4349 domain-containing protein [Kitasatospora sp. CM 4170]